MTAVEPSEEMLAPYWQRGATLLHQQCWCWGQDVRRPEGNLLLGYGFDRSRPPAHVSGSSRYTLHREGRRITLWGFGIAWEYDGCGGIYVNRYCFVPRWMGQAASVDTVWQASQLAGVSRPCTRREIRRSRRLLQQLMRFIAGYERWVTANYGIDYRRRTLAGWSHTNIPADRMAIEWELLAHHVEEPPP